MLIQTDWTSFVGNVLVVTYFIKKFNFFIIEVVDFLEYFPRWTLSFLHYHYHLALLPAWTCHHIFSNLSLYRNYKQWQFQFKFKWEKSAISNSSRIPFCIKSIHSIVCFKSIIRRTSTICVHFKLVSLCIVCKLDRNS